MYSGDSCVSKLSGIVPPPPLPHIHYTVFLINGGGGGSALISGEFSPPVAGIFRVEIEQFV